MTSARFMFRSTKTTPKGSVTKIYIETKEATAGMVVRLQRQTTHS